MARFAIIEGGVVTNIVEAEADYAATQGWVDASSANFGDSYSNGQFTKSAPVVDPLAYQAKRAAAYPPIGDQLDALFKAGVFPADMAAALQAVKDKYPKG